MGLRLALTDTLLKVSSEKSFDASLTVDDALAMENIDVIETVSGKIIFFLRFFCGGSVDGSESYWATRARSKIRASYWLPLLGIPAGQQTDIG